MTQTQFSLVIFKKVFEDEKSKFLQCVASENLIPEDQIYTDCKISELAEDSAYILFSNKGLDSADLLVEFKRFESKKNLHFNIREVCRKKKRWVA